MDYHQSGKHYFFIPFGEKRENGYISLKLIQMAKKQAEFMIQNLPLNENSRSLYFFVKIYQKLMRNYINETFENDHIKLNRNFIYEFCQFPFQFIEILDYQVPSHENLKPIDKILLKNPKLITKLEIHPSQSSRSLLLLEDEVFRKILSFEKYLTWIKKLLPYKYQKNFLNYILYHLEEIKKREYKRIIIPTVGYNEWKKEMKERTNNIKTISIYYEDLLDKLSYFLEKNEIIIQCLFKFKDYKYYENLENQIDIIINNLKNNYHDFISYIKKSIQILDETPVQYLKNLDRTDLYYIWIFDKNFILKNMDKIKKLIKIRLKMKSDLQISSFHNNLEIILFFKLNQYKDSESIIKEINRFIKTFKTESKLPLFPKMKKFEINFYESLQYIPSIYKWIKILSNTKKSVEKSMMNIYSDIQLSLSLLDSPNHVLTRFVKYFKECYQEYISFGKDLLDKYDYQYYLNDIIKDNHLLTIGLNEINIRKLEEWPQAEAILLRFEEKGVDWFDRVNTFLTFDFHIILKDIDYNTYCEILKTINMNTESLKNDLIIISKREAIYDIKRQKLFKTIESGKSSLELNEWLCKTFVPWYLISSRVKLSNFKKFKIPQVSWNDSSLSKFIESSIWIYKFMFDCEPNELNLIHFAFCILKKMKEEEIIYLCILKKYLPFKECTFHYIIQFIYMITSNFVINNVPLIKNFKLKETKTLFLKLIQNPPEVITSYTQYFKKLFQNSFHQ